MNEAVEGPLLADPLSDWSTVPIFEPFLNYRVDFNGADFAIAPSAAVPEPASVIVWFAIFGGLAVMIARQPVVRIEE